MPKVYISVIIISMKRKYWLEAIASFLVVGLGQIIKGEGKKGLKLLLAFYFVLPALIYVSLLINAFLFLVVFGLSLISAVILWVYSIWDALKHEAIV